MKKTSQPDPDKTYKFYLVEIDDDDRERVLSGLVKCVKIDDTPEYENVYSDLYQKPITSLLVNREYTLKAEMVPHADGHYWMIEDFSMMEGEEDA